MPSIFKCVVLVCLFQTMGKLLSAEEVKLELRCPQLEKAAQFSLKFQLFIYFACDVRYQRHKKIKAVACYFVHGAKNTREK